MEIARAIAASKGGNGKHVSFTDASNKTVALIKTIGTTTINGKLVAVVKVSATSIGLVAMARMSYFSFESNKECDVLVRKLEFEQAEFDSWLREYLLPENTKAILSPSNCARIVELSKPLSVKRNAVTTRNWKGLTVFGYGIPGFVQLAFCTSIASYIMLNHSMRTYVLIPDCLIDEESLYSDKNFEDFVHSEVLSDYSKDTHAFDNIM